MDDAEVHTIPVAHTPTGGYGNQFPLPILAGCSAPPIEGAPDLRGLWQTIEVSVDGQVQPAHDGLGHIQRVEQCHDRLVVTGGGVIHDMRCDGTEANGVHDVAQADMATEIHVVATYEDGVHVLRPAGVPIEVKRWRDGADMMWDYVGYRARLTKLGPPETNPDDVVPEARS